MAAPLREPLPTCAVRALESILIHCYAVRSKSNSQTPWNGHQIGLPEDYLPLLAPGRSAFVRETERIVSHGGASLEELVVPLVQIEMRDT